MIDIIIFIYYFIIIAALLIFLVDFKIYVTTPKATIISWPWWKYIPGGAIIAYYKFRKLE